MATFAQQMDAWTRKSEARMEAVFKEATQSLTFEVLTPVAKGGRLPVDTGFLINSFTAALNWVPSGPSQSPLGYNQQSLDASPIMLVINRASIGDRIAIGSAARYAEVIEAQRGFIRLAAQNWPQHVRNATNKVKREVMR